jgi:cytochrome P450
VTHTLPPGPRLPELAQGLWFHFRPVDLLRHAAKRYGNVWTLRQPVKLTNVIVAEPALAAQVFAADPAVMGGASPPVAQPLFGEHSVLLLDGPEHTAQRRLLAPPLESERIQEYRERMRVACEHEIGRLPLNEPVALLPHLRRIALKVMLGVLVGSSDQDDEISARISEMVVFSSSPARLGRLWLAHLRGSALPAAFVRIRAAIDALLFAEIASSRRDPRLDQRDDVLALLLRSRNADGGEMSDREIRDEVLTLLIQGHTSTGSALAWAIERLVRHPDRLERLYAEAQTDQEDYLEAVIYETLRVRPPLALATRRLHEPYTLGEYSLEPGTFVMTNAFMLHRREDVYPDPEVFRPERFLGNPPQPDAWIPFGGGTRGCIGASFALCEMRVVLRALAQKTRLIPAREDDEGFRRRGVSFDAGAGARVIVYPCT